MALTATATQGFELIRYTGEDEILYVPGDPGDTYTRGDAVTFTAAEGVADSVADSEYAYGIVQETITCPAIGTGIPRPADFDPVDKTGGNLHLVPVKMRVPSGEPVYKVTFAGQDDQDVASFVASTAVATITTGLGADDDANGAITYVYEGAGAGHVLVVADTTQATPSLTFHATPATALDSTSKIITLEGAGSGVGGIGFCGRIDAADDNNLDCADGHDNGDWLVLMDFRESATFLKNLTLPVIRASAMLES